MSIDLHLAPTTVTTTELLARFQPIFDRIGSGAVAREAERRLPFQEIEWLRGAGFGRLRVPPAAGGFGASLDQLVLLLTALGQADSNLPQALRGHIGFVEHLLTHDDAAFRTFWFAELVGGALVGNAESERTGTFGAPATRVRSVDGRLLLNGAKYYSTGSIFADWIFVSVGHETPGAGTPTLATALIRATAPGVQIHDDWDGFGQRLTGSGTTVFTDVEVDPLQLHPRTMADFTRTTQNAVFQLVHLAALAGIAGAALTEITDYTRSRRRNLFNPAVAPHEDPVALQVIGEAFGTVETVKASVLAAAATVRRVSDAQAVGIAEDADFSAAEAHVYGVQATVITLVLALVSRIFEVGGASATSTSRRLDRLWRNARTIASHNPASYRQRAVGDFVVNGVAPSAGILQLLAGTPGTGTPDAGDAEAGSPR